MVLFMEIENMSIKCGNELADIIEKYMRQVMKNTLVVVKKSPVIHDPRRRLH